MSVKKPIAIPKPVISDHRRDLVDQARRKWIGRLIDFSRRNNLLYFRELKSGTLDVSKALPETMKELLQGDPVPLSKMLPGVDEATGAARLQEIRRRALANLEEKGLDTLFLALGMATWTQTDEGRQPEAPILLIPIAVENQGREGRSVALKLSGEIQVNLVLLQYLQDQFAISINPESLLAVLQGEDDAASFDPTPAFDLLRRQVTAIKGFQVVLKMAISNFSFQKMAMVRDLVELQKELPEHDVIAAISGDSDARTRLFDNYSDVELRELDAVPADAEYLVLDADSSQQRVVAIVQKGQHCVVQGPPGTGKSQTIANLIASLGSQGKRVLFVAEKRAALSVVLDRLERIGLGHLALDLHGADLTRQQILKKVARGLEIVHESVAVDEKLHRQFEERRKQLNQHDARMHQVRVPGPRVLFDIQSRLVGLSHRASKTRWRDADLDRLTAEAAARVRDMLLEAGGLGGLFLRTDPSPWTGALLTDGKTVSRTIETVNQLATRLLPSLVREIEALKHHCPDVPADTFGRIEGFLRLAEEAAAIRGKFTENVFDADLPALVSAMQPAGKGKLSHLSALGTNTSYRRALRNARAVYLEKEAPIAQLLNDLTVVRNHVDQWKKFSTKRPPVLDVAAAVRVMADCKKELETLSRSVPAVKNEQTFDHLRRVVSDLAADNQTPHLIPRLLEIEAQLLKLGLLGFVRELRQDQPPAEGWPDIFEHAWLWSQFDRIQEEDPAVGAFNGRTHDKFVDEFKTLDLQRIELARLRVRRSHAERAVKTMSAHPEQTALIRREAEKKTRHLTLRRLLTEAPDVLTALCPCWMASPLSVSQLLPPNRNCFDYVIFDEASQVLPEDAVPSIYRGRHLVVAGDKHQLPPTAFFAATDEPDEQVDDDTPGLTEGFESLLDLSSSFMRSAPLNWHYRSRDERLIAFSNRHIYDDRLITFPGPGGPTPVFHVLVEQSLSRDGEEESAPAEVQSVVDLVLRHAKERPNETLGVIAMGITHARRVEAALDIRLRSRPDLDEFFEQNKAERFFIKNLERVQGDERDAVILTIGYGKDRSGKLMYRFGPLLQEGGERRLNVAITRARKRMTLVSSFNHLDMDLQRIRSRGVELLRSYIEYTSSQKRYYGDAVTTSFPLNDFERDVIEALTARGMKVTPQMGTCRYRIDLVVQDPAQPGRFLLAIESDGATYHSSPTARDRDRLRQQHLEALGWKFHRIWSTDWLLRKGAEIERVVRAYETALAASAPARANSSMLEIVANESTADRPARPRIRQCESIDEYQFEELVRIVRWIKSDERLRTEEEMILEATHELGFKRRGAKIDQVLKRAILAIDLSGGLKNAG